MTVAERETSRGRIVVRRIRPGLLHSTASGHICCQIIETLMRAADEEMAATDVPFEHFLDWSGVDSYDTDARVAAMPPMVASAPGSMGKNRPVLASAFASCR